MSPAAGGTTAGRGPALDGTTQPISSSPGVLPCSLPIPLPTLQTGVCFVQLCIEALPTAEDAAPIFSWSLQICLGDLYINVLPECDSALFDTDAVTVLLPKLYNCHGTTAHSFCCRIYRCSFHSSFSSSCKIRCISRRLLGGIPRHNFRHPRHKWWRCRNFPSSNISIPRYSYDKLHTCIYFRYNNHAELLAAQQATLQGYKLPNVLDCSWYLRSSNCFLTVSFVCRVC